MSAEKPKKLRGITFRNEPNRRLKWCWTRVIDGRRVRTFFATEDAAVRAKAAAEAESRKGADARRVFDARAQREYDAARRILAGTGTLVDAALWWRETAEQRSPHNALVPAVVEQVLANLQSRGVSTAFFASCRLYLRAFARAFSDRDIASISGREAADWILGWRRSAVTLADIRRKLIFLFNRARDMEFLRVVPAIPAELLPKPRPSPVAVYTAEEAERLMRSLVTDRSPHLPAVALRLFCGLRRSEANAMRWEWIDEARKRIVIPHTVCKTRDDWVLQSPALPPTVWRFFAVVPAAEKHGAFRALHARALQAILARAHVRPQKNGFRHTFCTMHISLADSAEKTALLLRHRGTQTLYRHYLAKLVDKAEAERFFAIAP